MRERGHLARPGSRPRDGREPVIAEWKRGRFGITPCSFVYSSGANPRDIASPGDVSLDPFTGELLYGDDDAVFAEFRTSQHDLTPGRLDATRTLVEIDQDS